MTSGHVLVVADSDEAVQRLAQDLLPGEGYTVTIADHFTPPPDTCDVVVVDVARLRSSPLAGLQAQRRMGCMAPALLIAPRLTDEMASTMFALDVRDFTPAPADPAVVLDKLDELLTFARREDAQSRLQSSLNQAQADLTRRLEEMNALSRIGRSITSLTEVDTIFAHIVEAGVYLTRADEGAIFLRDEISGTVMLRAEMGFEDEGAATIAQPSEDSEVMAVMETGLPIVRSANEEHKIKTGYMVRALINTPVIVNREVIGVLGVYNHGDRNFDAADQTILVNLADYAAIAIDKIRSISQFAERVGEALKTSRTVVQHAETFHDPIEGIESLADTLLAGGYGPLEERQHTAVSRIKHATVRLKEVQDLIQQTIRDFEQGQ